MLELPDIAEAQWMVFLVYIYDIRVCGIVKSADGASASVPRGRSRPGTRGGSHPKLSTVCAMLSSKEETIFSGARHFQSAGHLTFVMLGRVIDSPKLLSRERSDRRISLWGWLLV